MVVQDGDLCLEMSSSYILKEERAVGSGNFEMELRMCTGRLLSDMQFVVERVECVREDEGCGGIGDLRRLVGKSGFHS